MSDLSFIELEKIRMVLSETSIFMNVKIVVIAHFLVQIEIFSFAKKLERGWDRSIFTSRIRLI